MKIALGTVQFGLDYGVANTSGRVSKNAAKEIIKLAHELGVDTMDTAAAYGSSEQVLGNIGVDNFKLISKTPPSFDTTDTPESWISNCAEQSLARLGVDSLYGLLLHRPMELLQANGLLIYEALVEIKRRGLVKKIGVSVYGPEELEKLLEFDFDIVQAPMNILDRRMENSGWLDQLSKRGTEVHIRSAFLQGLLLMPSDHRPSYFAPWQSLLSKYDEWIAGEKLTPLQACLGYLNTCPAIEKIVVGVDTAHQLREIVSSINEPSPLPPIHLQTNDLNLINPALWKI